MPLHLQKLAVGARSVADLRAWQKRRRAEAPPLRHRTRNFPRRFEEILDGGSLYWVIDGTMTVRQRIVDIREARREDGTACTDLVLGPKLVLVAPRPVRAFQGWRYLEARDAPADLAASEAGTLPEDLRRELARAGLI